jgi:hypothetical protein
MQGASELFRRDLDAAPYLGRRGAIACGLAVVLGGAVYVNALDNPFIYDDFRLIVENGSLSDLSNIPAAIRRDATRPIVSLSYVLDRAIWGPGVFGFHLTSILLHMLNVGLLGRLAWHGASDLSRQREAGTCRLRPFVIAPVAALLFAVHPMMTTAVGYISGRSEVICGTFFLIALLAARRGLAGGRPRWFLAAMACWLVALGAKEIAVMFPLVVLAYDRWVGGAEGRSRAVGARRFQLALLGLGAALAVGRLLVFLAVEHRDLQIHWPLIFVELDVIGRYVLLLVRPEGQTIFHAVPPLGLVGVARVIAVGTALGSLAWFVWSRRVGLGGFGVLWFVLLLVPSSVLVVLDRGAPMAEHRVYLASGGLFLSAGLVADVLTAWLGARRPWMPRLLAAGLLAIVAGLAARTILRNALAESPVLVWTEAAERAPDHGLPRLLLAEELHRAGRHDEATAAYRRGLTLQPQAADAYGKLGVCLLERGDSAGAREAFETLRALDAASPEASNGLATVAFLQGRLDEARQGYLGTLTLDPANLAARRGLAVLAEAAGDAAMALRWCEELGRLAAVSPQTNDCIRRIQIQRLHDGDSAR